MFFFKYFLKYMYKCILYNIGYHLIQFNFKDKYIQYVESF